MNKENIAPSRSILKGEKGDKRDNTENLSLFSHSRWPSRRVSFHPEVTLHKIEMVPPSSEKRRETIAFAPQTESDDDTSTIVSWGEGYPYRRPNRGNAESNSGIGLVEDDSDDDSDDDSEDDSDNNIDENSDNRNNDSPSNNQDESDSNDSADDSDKMREPSQQNEATEDTPMELTRLYPKLNGDQIMINNEEEMELTQSRSAMYLNDPYVHENEYNFNIGGINTQFTGKKEQQPPDSGGNFTSMGLNESGFSREGYIWSSDAYRAHTVESREDDQEKEEIYTDGGEQDMEFTQFNSTYIKDFLLQDSRTEYNSKIIRASSMSPNENREYDKGDDENVNNLSEIPPNCIAEQEIDNPDEDGEKDMELTEVNLSASENNKRSLLPSASPGIVESGREDHLMNDEENQEEDMELTQHHLVRSIYGDHTYKQDEKSIVPENTGIEVNQISGNDGGSLRQDTMSEHEKNNKGEGAPGRSMPHHSPTSQQIVSTSDYINDGHYHESTHDQNFLNDFDNEIDSNELRVERAHEEVEGLHNEKSLLVSNEDKTDSRISNNNFNTNIKNNESKSTPERDSEVSDQGFHFRNLNRSEGSIHNEVNTVKESNIGTEINGDENEDSAEMPGECLVADEKTYLDKIHHTGEHKQVLTETKETNKERSDEMDMQLSQPVSVVYVNSSAPSNSYSWDKSNIETDEENRHFQREQSKDFIPITGTKGLVQDNDATYSHSMNTPRHDERVEEDFEGHVNDKQENSVEGEDTLSHVNTSAKTMLVNPSEVTEAPWDSVENGYEKTNNHKRKFENVDATLAKFPKKDTMIAPLADVSVDSIDEFDENYIPVTLYQFLEDIGIRFYDDLDIGLESIGRMSLSLTRVGEEDYKFSDFVRAVNRVLFLELYDFSCKELTRNIDDGKILFDQFNDTTKDDNPKVFKRFYCCDEIEKLQMQTSFRLVKDLARQQAKSVWYGWRTQLMENLISQLNERYEILAHDISILKDNIYFIQSSTKLLKEALSKLKEKLHKLRVAEEQFKGMDESELVNYKSEIVSIASKLKANQRQITEKSNDLNFLTNEINKLDSLIASYNLRVNEMKNLIESSKKYEVFEIDAIKKEFDHLMKSSNLIFKGVFESKLNFVFDEAIDISMNFEDINKLSNIDFSPIPFCELHFKCPDLLKKYISQLPSLFSCTNIIDCFKNYKFFWCLFKKLDQDIGKIALKFPVSFLDHSDPTTVSLKIRYYSHKHDFKVDFVLRANLRHLPEYPNKVEMEGQVTKFIEGMSEELVIKSFLGDCITNSLIDHSKIFVRGL